MPRIFKTVNHCLFIVLVFWFFICFSGCQPVGPPAEHIYVRLDSLKADSAPFPRVMRSPGFIASISQQGKTLDSNHVSSFKIPLIDELMLKDKTASKAKLDSIGVQVTQRKDEVRYTVDKNNNGIFDEPYLSPAEEHSWNEIQNVSLPIAGKYLRTSYFLLKVKSTMQFESTSNRNKFSNREGFAAMPIYRYGVFTARDSAKYRFALFNYFLDRYTKEVANLVIVPSGTEFPQMDTYPVRYKVGDTIFLNKYIYTFSNVSVAGDSVDLQFVRELDKNYGAEKDRYAFPIRFNSIIDGSSGYIGKTGRYTLLDFWGTWCGPCLALTPYLKNLYIQKRKHVDFIGIAYDDDKVAVRDYVTSHSIDWPIVFDDRKRPEISAMYKINGYPTFVLIDPEGKIVVRSTGPKVMIDIEEYFKSHDL